MKRIAYEKDVVFELDLQSETITLHQAGPWADMLNLVTGKTYPYGSVVRSLVDQFCDRDDKAAFMHIANPRALRAAFARQEPLQTIDIRIRSAHSDLYEWYRVTLIAPIDGKCNGTMQNIQAEKEAELLIRRQAEHDSLTDLLNRTAFDAAIQERFKRGVRNAAFLIIDIDDFKEINDTRGHQHGDAVIIQIAARLNAIMPEDALIGRFGGDEFMLFLATDLSEVDEGDFRQTVRALCAKITTPDPSEGCTLSLGASFYPSDGISTKELLGCADRALYFVKHNGKGNYALFEPYMSDSYEHDRTKPKTRRARMQIHWRRLIPALAALLMAVTFLLTLANAYTTNLQNMIRGDSLDYLHEIATQIDTSTVKTLNAYAAQMRIIGDTLTYLSPDMDMDALCAFLQKQSESIGCDSISVVDDDTIWHSVSGQTKLHEFNAQVAKCVVDQSIYMSEAVNVRGVDYVLVFMPVDIATSDGYHAPAIVAFLRFDVMSRILSLTAFDGQGHADILTMDGRVVMRASQDDSIIDGYNLFSTLRDTKFTDDSSYADLFSAFTAGQAGSCRISQSGVEYILHYRKLGYQDWMLLTSVPASALEARSQAFMRITVYICAAITLVFCALLLSLVFLQERSKAKLERLAYVDAITGGASYEKFRMDVTRLLTHKDSGYTMVYTNIDRFKVFNDRLGTDGANGLLRHIASVLGKAVRSNEAVGRIDADHFGILLATQNVDEIVGRIRGWSRLIASYPPAKQAALTVSMSYGVYIVDNHKLSVELLLDRSNLARTSMAHATEGSPRISFYDENLHEMLLREQLIGDSMETALVEDRFLLYLQPKYATESGALIGFEALVRWQTEHYGLLLPGVFIPTLEKNGFIVRLDLYVFEQVLKLLRARMDAGKPPVCVSFNVSRVHLNSDNLLAPYLSIWESYQIPPAFLEFEFTESVISDYPERLWRVVEDIHHYGFRCSMDDFGSGYSSLNMLHETNVDVVKLDKQFLGDDDEPSARSKAIIRAVVSLARELGMTTVAEGVEHEPQAAFLKEIGCDEIQGFYFAEPMPALDALALLDADASPHS